MPRRASSGISIGQIFGLLAGITFILVIAGVLFWVFAGSGFSSGAGKGPRNANHDLVISEYLQNANALRGNAYNVSGKIDQQLKWTPDRGRLISLTVSDSSGESPVPIHVPPEFNHVNIEAGADFNFVVEVGNDGILKALSVN